MPTLILEECISLEGYLTNHPDLPDESLDLEAKAVDNILVAEILTILSDRQRQIILLKMLGFANKEIARIISISESTIEKEVSRVRSRTARLREVGLI